MSEWKLGRALSNIIGLFTLTDYTTPLQNTAKDIIHISDDKKTFWINAIDLGYVENKILKKYGIEYWSAERAGPLTNSEAHFTVKAKDQRRVENLLWTAGIKKRWG